MFAISQQGMRTLVQALETALTMGVIEFMEALVRAQQPEDLGKALADRNLHNGEPKESVSSGC